MRQQSSDRSTIPTSSIPHYRPVQSLWVRWLRWGGSHWLFHLCIFTVYLAVIFIVFFQSLLVQRPWVAIVPFALVGLLLMGGRWALNAQKRGCIIRHTLRPYMLYYLRSLVP